MTGPAMQKCLDTIADVFRPERKQREFIVFQGLRVHELVEAGRYSFEEACKLLDVSEARLGVALFWLKEDDARILREHAYTTLSRAHAFETLAWFRRNTRMSQLGNSLFNMMSAINTATFLQREIGQ
jgi:hypothetical protein